MAATASLPPPRPHLSSSSSAAASSGSPRVSSSAAAAAAVPAAAVLSSSDDPFGGGDVLQFLRFVHARSADVTGTLLQLEAALSAAPVAASAAAVSRLDASVSNRWPIVATQLQSLQTAVSGGGGASPSLAAARALCERLLLVPRSGSCSPADALRIRAAPDVDADQADSSARAAQSAQQQRTAPHAATQLVVLTAPSPSLPPPPPPLISVAWQGCGSVGMQR